MKLEISSESGFLRVTAVGRFSLPEAKRTFLEMLEAAARQKVKKVVFDGRGLEGAPERMERFYYGEFAATMMDGFTDRGMLSRATKFGYVLEEPVLDPQRFGETVAVNRGMLVKTFDNLPGALAWLEIVPGMTPNSDDGR